MKKIKMNNLNKNKRAMFFTLSMFFLAMTIFAFAVMINDYISKDRMERAEEVYALDRLYDSSVPVEHNIEKMLDLNYARNSSSEIFEKEVENFGVFVSQNSEIKLSINATKPGNLFYINGSINMTIPEYKVYKIRNISLQR